MTRRPDEAPDSSSSGSSPGAFRQVGRYGGHGLTIAAATALFAWGGDRLDLWLGTAPLFVILGALVGLGGGFMVMYRDLVLERRGDEERSPESDG